MIGCLRTRVRKQPIIALNFEFENEHKFYNLEAWSGYLTLEAVILLNGIIKRQPNLRFTSDRPVYL